MKAYLLGAALVAVAAPAAAQSPFDGTYRMDIASAQLPKKPLNRALKAGVYRCDCDTPLEVKADGQWHKVSGQAYSDEMRVEAVDDNRLRMEGRKGSKPSFASDETVSPDGMTVNWTSIEYSATDGKPVNASGKDKRVGALPVAGLHRINGGWVTVTDGLQVDPAGITMTFKPISGGMSRTAGTGETYEAKFGGPAVPLRNDPAGTMVAVRQISPTKFEERMMRNGKLRAILTYEMKPDGKIFATNYNPIQKTTATITMTKQ
ncbi:MAG: hypothetical protein A4S12_00935 [Proteobacteria bacterium SG_bin5]|nr:hypothetical protein [Sphingomonas sp.]OQW42235.1 MAG: hypothetical protein A4S12_00935 [Proteobacteria bacterium SG_bin5]